MTFIKPTTLLVGALCLSQTAAEENVTFNNNVESNFVTGTDGHVRGLFSSKTIATTANSGVYKAPSECKTACEADIATAAGASTTFGGYFLCWYKGEQTTNAATYNGECKLESVLFTASDDKTGYPTKFDPRKKQLPTFNGSSFVMRSYSAWYYTIDTANMGAISAANPVSKCLAPPTACPTLPEITEGVTGGLYAELFAGFAAAKAADATLTSPSQQPVAGSAVGEKMGTLEKRFETMTGSTDVQLTALKNKVAAIDGKLLASGSTWTTLEAGFKSAKTTCPDEAAIKKAVTDAAPKPPADAAELRFAATLLASVAVLAPFA